MHCVLCTVKRASYTVGYFFPLNLLYLMQLCSMVSITLPIFLMGKPRRRGDHHSVFYLEHNSLLTTVKC